MTRRSERKKAAKAAKAAPRLTSCIRQRGSGRWSRRRWPPRTLRRPGRSLPMAFAAWVAAPARSSAARVGPLAQSAADRVGPSPTPPPSGSARWRPSVLADRPPDRTVRPAGPRRVSPYAQAAMGRVSPYAHLATERWPAGLRRQEARRPGGTRGAGEDRASVG